MLKRLLVFVVCVFSIGCTHGATSAPPVSGSAFPAAGHDVVQQGAPWQFFSPIYAQSITPGKDGAMWAAGWATGYGSGQNVIWRIDMAGKTTSYPLHSGWTILGGICPNPDGNVYFPEVDAQSNMGVGQITPLGVITDYPLGVAIGSGNSSITSSTAGNLWAGYRTVKFNQIVSGVVHLVVGQSATNYNTVIVDSNVVLGPDGRIWGSDHNGGLGQAQNFAIDSLGNITLYPNGSAPGLLVSAFGDIWGAEGTGGGFQRITTSGVVTNYGVKNGHNDNPFSLTAGRAGILYFVGKVAGGHTLGIQRYSTIKHLMATMLDYPDQSKPAVFISFGVDGNLWAATTTGVWVYDLRLITPTPTSLTLGIGTSQSLSVTEKLNTKQLQAVSNDPSIATVAASGFNTFSVTGRAHGQTAITISDAIGNSQSVPVTVN